MIDGTEKPKLPSKFAKGTARYNEFSYNISKIKLPNFKVICFKRATTTTIQTSVKFRGFESLYPRCFSTKHFLVLFKVDD